MNHTSLVFLQTLLILLFLQFVPFITFTFTNKCMASAYDRKKSNLHVFNYLTGMCTMCAALAAASRGGLLSSAGSLILTIQRDSKHQCSQPGIRPCSMPRCWSSSNQVITEAIVGQVLLPRGNMRGKNETM